MTAALIGNRYKLKGPTLSGGMSHASLFKDEHLGRDVIIKRLQPGEEARRLLDEQKALLLLRSKHVVQLLDIVQYSDGSSGLVLEYISGSDLAPSTYVEDRSYLETVWQIASGLSDIHAQGVVHRDIKPNNLRIDKDGVVKIIDFGLSREIGKDNKTKNAIGYLPYIAPEFFTSGTISFSERVDTYSFGITALSLVRTGIPSWVARGPISPVLATAVQAHIPATPPAIQTVFHHCLDHNPLLRPRMVDVAEALKRHLVHDRHRARLSLGGNIYEINSGKRTSTPNIQVGGVLTVALGIEYDGQTFKVNRIVGAVKVNNVIPFIGFILPSNCVIEFGGLKSGPIYATFDVSNPEVMA